MIVVDSLKKTEIIFWEQTQTAYLIQPDTRLSSALVHVQRIPKTQDWDQKEHLNEV